VSPPPASTCRNPKAMESGNWLRLVVTLAWCAVHETHAMWLPWASVPGPDVRLNSVGYTPMQTKRASIPFSRVYGDPTHWKVHRCHWGEPAFGDHAYRCLADEVVLRGDWIKSPVRSDMGRLTWTADFSELRAPGTYIMKAMRSRLGHVVWSVAFVVADDVFHQPLLGSVESFTLARCGVAVGPIVTRSGAAFEHGACHTHDATVDHRHTGESGEAHALATAGGWHDAGDYGKYTVNTAFSVGLLLFAHEHFGRAIARALEHTNSTVPPPAVAGTPRFLDEVRWGLAWMLTMQREDGAVYHKLTPTEFADLQVFPDDDNLERFLAPPSSIATASLAAVAAAGARAFARYDVPFAQACLRAARLAHAWLREHSTPSTVVAPDQGPFTTGTYDSKSPTHLEGASLWAAAELWQTTGDGAYWVEVESLLRGFDAPADECADLSTRRDKYATARCAVEPLFDWSSMTTLGTLRVLLGSTQPPPPLVDGALRARAKSVLLAVADTIADAAHSHPYGRPVGRWYKWGVNGAIARQALTLHAGAVVAEAAADHARVWRYRSAAALGLAHLLGANDYGRSYVTHIGNSPPNNPHHRPSMAEHRPWPFLLVGGPWPHAGDWTDDKLNYQTNEVAINWQASLVYALAMFCSDQDAPAALVAEPFTPTAALPVHRLATAHPWGLLACAGAVVVVAAVVAARLLLRVGQGVAMTTLGSCAVRSAVPHAGAPMRPSCGVIPPAVETWDARPPSFAGVQAPRTGVAATQGETARVSSHGDGCAAVVTAVGASHTSCESTTSAAAHTALLMRPHQHVLEMC